MNPQQRPAAALQPSVATPAEARKLAERIAADDGCAAEVDRTGNRTCPAAGRIREAILLDSAKSDLSRRYVSAIAGLRVNQRYMAQMTPDLLATLHRHHDTFRAMLQVKPDGAGDGACGIGRHRAWRQRRDAAPRRAVDIHRIGQPQHRGHASCRAAHRQSHALTRATVCI